MNNLDTLRVHVRTELELDRTKFIGIAVLFVFFGLTSVLTQMFMPEIMKLSGLEIVNLPKPSVEQVFADYWGDAFTFAMILILFFMSTFSAELDVNKSVYFYLARPISRQTYYLTRFWLRVVVVISLFFTVSLLVYGYSLFYFKPIAPSHIILSALLVSLALGSVTSQVIALSGWLSSSRTGIAGFVIIFIQLLLGLIKPLRWLSPFALSDLWQDILFKDPATSTIIYHISGLICWIIIPCIAGLLNYRHRDLI